MKYNILLIFLLFVSLLFGAIEDLQDFETAKQAKTGKELQAKYTELIEKDAQSYSGQRALFELAKISMLNREYEKAEALFRQIFDERITDKEFWLAKCYLKLEDATRAIISSQNFICDSSDITKIESAYFIIAEAYIISSQYKRALNTLESLRTSAYIQNYIPLMYFKKGYCQEKLKKYTGAVTMYKKLKLEYPYHELSFIAEERIYNIQDSELIDFEVLEKRVVKTTKETLKSGNELKMYLQAGAFGAVKNAEKLGSKITNIGYSYIIFDKMKNGKKLYCVAAGPFENSNKVKNAISKLKNNQINSYMIKRY